MSCRGHVMRSTVSTNSQGIALVVMQDVLVVHVVLNVGAAMRTASSRLHSLVLLRAAAVVGEQTRELKWQI